MPDAFAGLLEKKKQEQANRFAGLLSQKKAEAEELTQQFYETMPYRTEADMRTKLGVEYDIPQPYEPSAGMAAPKKPILPIAQMIQIPECLDAPGPVFDPALRDVKDARRVLGQCYSDMAGRMIDMKTGKPLNEFDYNNLEWVLENAPNRFSAQDRQKMYMIENSLHPLTKDVPHRLKWLMTYVMTWGGRIGPLFGITGLREELIEEATEFPGWSGQLAVNAGDAALFYIKYVMMLPALIGKTKAALGGFRQLPRVKKVIDAVEKAGGIKWVEKHFPRTLAGARSAIDTFGATLAVATPVEAVEAWGEGKTLKEAWPEIRRNALIYAAITTTFDVASSIDRARYIKQLRKALVARVDADIKAKSDQLRAKLKVIQATKPPGERLTYPRTVEEVEIQRGIKSLAGIKTTSLRAVDRLVAELEAEMLEISRGDIYKQKELVRESAIEAAERIAREGITAIKETPRGYEPLEKGLGKREPFIRMPTTRLEEAVEAVKETVKPSPRPTKPPSAAEVGITPGARVPKPPAEAPTVVPPPQVVGEEPAEARASVAEMTTDELREEYGAKTEKAAGEIYGELHRRFAEQEGSPPEGPESNVYYQRRFIFKRTTAELKSKLTDYADSRKASDKQYVEWIREELEKRKAERPIEVEMPPEPEGPGTVDNINIVGLADFFEPRVRDEVETGRTITNPQLKLWVSEALKAPLEDLTPEKGYSHKKVQEALELALVRRARRIIEENVDDPDETFKQLQKLYENQPALTTRTGKSIERQAYSTPAPLAYGASLLAHIEPETEMVYEPTAGTGMLLIAAEPDSVIANELDDTRAKALKSQGFKVGQKDATTLKEMPQVADAVIMNPPFGKAKEPQVFDGYELTKLEHIIAANALGAMQNEGRAVMIIAAPKVQGEYSKPDWVFSNYVYSHYNVIGDFEVSGDLYARQGAAWPVRVIAVHGRHTTEKVGPKKGKIRATSWEETYNIIQEILKNEPTEVETDEVVPAAAGREPQRPERVGRGAGERREPTGELGPIREPAEPEVAPTGEAAGPERGGPARVEGGRVLPTGRVGAGRPDRTAPSARQVPREQRGGERMVVPEREPAGRTEREEPGPRVPEAERGREEGVAEGREPARMVGRPAGRAVSQAVQVIYKPASKGPQENENIPKYLEPHVKRALADLEQAVGPVDDFVREQLQYASNKEMWEHLSANQVDSLALALYRLAKNTAMIIGHQTGVGKGRIAAGIVRHIIKKGEPTLVTFFTARKDLFSDFYRDLIDVGLTEDEIRPLMINADVDIKDQQDRVVFKRHGNRQRANAAIKKAIKGEADYNLVLTTYSQINKETYQQRGQILDLARNRILILDESHRAAGDSNTGEYMRNGLIPTASGVLFMSATYSKRPDTMALYYRTGIIDAFDGDSESMIAAIKAGGEPFQEVISAALAQTAFYVRTELDFSGVDYQTLVDAQHIDRDKWRADQVTDVLRDVLVFDELVVKGLIDKKNKTAKAIAKATKSPSTTITHSSFASVAWNAIKQMLLALKIDETVEQTKQAIKEGRRVVIALENTMESFLKRYIEARGIQPGERLVDFDYRNVLESLLESTLRMRVVHPSGREEVVGLDDLKSDIEYQRILEKIRGLTELELPGSPIDEIISRLEAEGIKVGEITGRDNRVIKRGKDYILDRRARAEKDKTSVAYKFNNGDIQVLITNVSGAEGISLHSSAKFKNQEPRRMIVAQPAGDINVFVQLLGRTNRKAQVAPPEYRVLMTALPSEIRPAAILEKKMRSLNANTSAKTKGIYQQKYVPDILNCYGDYIVNQYLLENPEVLHKLHLALCVTELDGLDNYRGPEEMARQFTGKASLLPIEEQQAFYEWAEGAYNDLVDMLDRTGQNELVSQDKDFRAKLISSQEIYTGEPGSVFQGPATLDKMSVVRQGRPMTTDEIADFVDDAIKRSGAEYGPNQGEVAYVNLFGEKVRQAFEQFTNQREAQGKKVTGPMQDASYRSYQLLNHLRPGQWRTNQQTGEPFVVLEIIDTFNQKSYAINPAAPSNIRVRIAIPDPVQTVIMPLSAIGNTPTYYGQIPKEEFFNVPADRREDRYIANGNIIAAMGIVVGQGTTHIRPKVLNYTMADGSRRQGLLMPKNYDPQADLPTTVRMLPQAAVTYLTEAAPGRYFVTVGEASIGVRNRELAYIQVPKSKARGLKYYGDSKLIELTGDFESRGNVMQALFPKERLLEVLTYLRDKGEGIYSDDTDPETAREYNKAYRDMGTGGTEDMGFPAGKPPKREIPVSLEPVVKPKKPMSAREIVRYISNAFGVPVRGVATFRKKRPGWYSRRTRGIRLKNVNDLRTACHEIGHHIDVYLNNLATQKMSTAWGGIGAEMVRLGKRLYGKKRPEGGYKAEGYAEAIFGYLTGGINLQEEAPRFWQFFTQHYLPDNANIAEILDAAKRMVQLWEDQGAETRVESMILDKPLKDDRRTRWEGFKLWWSTMFTDEFAPIQKLLDENVIGRTEEKASADPGFLAGFFTQTEGARARAFVMDGTMDVWGNRTGPSLKEILAPVADDIVNFTKYVVAIRAMMYEARGFTSGFQYEDVVYVYKKYHNPLWYKVAEDVTEWNHSVLQYLIDAGGLEPEAAERMRQLNPIYVPFMRAFAPYEKRLRKGVGGGLLTRAKGVYKIIGSGRPIKDPWDSMILQTRRILSIAHKTMIARALVQLEATHEGLAGVLEKVPPPTQAVHFNAEQIRKQLVQLGIDVAPGDLSDAMMTVFLNSPIFLGKEHVISVVVNGKRLWYEVDKDLYRVLEGLDQFQLPRLLNLTLGKFNRAGRLGATGINPSFGLVKNPIRDAFDSIVKAEHARGPVALIKGTAKDLQTTSLAKMLKVNPSEAARRFRVLGGQIGTYWGQDRTSLAHLKGEMLANTIGKYTLHTVTHPVDVLRAVIGVPESGLRIEEFEQALEYWMAKYQPQGGEPPPDAIVYAFLKASDQTINYRRHGVIGKWLNSMILFWNANTQDISKVYRTFKNRPKQAMYYGIAFLTLPALGLWWLNKDEDWYKELPAYEKANYLHIRLPGKNKILRLPVPFIVGHIFQGVPVAIIDTLYQSDPDRIIELCKEIFDADIQPLFDWPHAVSPFWDVARNKDWSDRPIVPKSVEGKLPSDQYKQYTTRICKEIGKLLNMSPAQIEHVINTWSGGIYRRTIVPLEQAFRLEEKEMVAADWPLIGKLFVRDPYAPRASIERFYKRVDYLNRVRQSKKDEMTVAELIEYSAHNRIARGIAPYWDDLREAKTEEERKVIYEDIGFWIKMAAEWSG